MRDRSARPSLEPGRYRHFKGGEYEVLDVLPDWSEGREDDWMVRYRTSLGEVGLRRYEEFVGAIYRDGKSQPRFEKIDDN